MANTEVKLIVTAEDRASAELNKIKNTTTEVGTGATKSFGQMTEQMKLMLQELQKLNAAMSANAKTTKATTDEGSKAAKTREKDTSRIVGLIREERQEDRLRGFAIRAVAESVGGLSLALVGLGLVSKSSSKDMDEIVKAGRNAIVTFEGISFAMRALGATAGTAAGIGAIVALFELIPAILAAINDEAKKGGEALAKMFSEQGAEALTVTISKIPGIMTSITKKAAELAKQFKISATYSTPHGVIETSRWLDVNKKKEYDILQTRISMLSKGKELLDDAKKEAELKETVSGIYDDILAKIKLQNDELTKTNSLGVGGAYDTFGFAQGSRDLEKVQILLKDVLLSDQARLALLEQQNAIQMANAEALKTQPELQQRLIAQSLAKADLNKKELDYQLNTIKNRRQEGDTALTQLNDEVRLNGQLKFIEASRLADMNYKLQSIKDKYKNQEDAANKIGSADVRHNALLAIWKAKEDEINKVNEEILGVKQSILDADTKGIALSKQRGDLERHLYDIALAFRANAMPIDTEEQIKARDAAISQTQTYIDLIHKARSLSGAGELAAPNITRRAKATLKKGIDTDELKAIKDQTEKMEIERASIFKQFQAKQSVLFGDASVDRINIEKDAQLKTLQIDEDAEARKMALARRPQEEIAAMHALYAEKRKSIEEKLASDIQAIHQKYPLGEEFTKGLEMAMKYASEVTSILSDANQTQLDNELSAIQTRQTAQDDYYANLLNNEKLTASQRKKILAQQKVDDLKLKDEERKARAKAFAQDKAIRIAQTTMAGAQAFVDALTAGPILGPILAGLTAAMTAAQIAIISSQNPPAFKEGGIMGTFGRVPFDNDPSARLAVLHVGESVRTPKQEAEIQSKPSTIVNIHFNSPVPHGTWIKESVQSAMASTGLSVDKYFVNTKRALTI